MEKESILNMVTAAADKKAIDFGSHFETAFAEKVLAKIENMKTTIAQNFFNKPE